MSKFCSAISSNYFIVAIQTHYECNYEKVFYTIRINLNALVSCKSDNKPHGLLAPDTMLSINLREKLPIRAESETPQAPFTPRETLEKIKVMYFIGYGNATPSELGIPDEHKDFENLTIKLWGKYIIYQGDGTHPDGDLNEYFIRAKNVIFTTDVIDRKADTVAYIPNRVLQEAYVKVKEAYDAGDYETVYRLFKEAYTAIHITGKEYRELQAKGLN